MTNLNMRSVDECDDIARRPELPRRGWSHNSLRRMSADPCTAQLATACHTPSCLPEKGESV